MTSSANDVAMGSLIEKHLTALRAEGAAHNTIRSRGRLLRRLHEDLPYGLLYATTDELREWLAYEPWSQWTRCTYTGHVIGGYHWLWVEGYIDIDPADPLARPPSPRPVARPLTNEQLAVMLAAPEPLRTASMLAAYQGMRRAEITGCHREHITQAITFIPVAKGGSAETVPTHPAVWEHVRHLPPGPLIVGPHGPLNADQLSWLAGRYQRQHGLPTGMHTMRHWYGTEMQRRVRDIRVTQECLRHRSLGSTQIYTQVTDRQRAEAVAALPVLGVEPVSGRLDPPAA